MQTYKRSVVLQLGVFGFFFFYGLDTIIKSLIDSSLVYSIVELVLLLVILGIGLFFYYKTPKDLLVVVTDKEIKQIKLSLYSVSAALIISILISGLQLDANLKQYLEIATGVLISLSGLFGVYLGVGTLQKNK
ncbi:hypothetical protein JN09_000841 [Acholeplasma morum]|uniref:hypothetical protein n=1 Tax=Paracholeplasma morum TaxID=264637 RepID=UPI00195C2B40|nr:hypothetical protein [Paracholeplasma morum]MBM7453511.1 hypothetical protein [Paracholeplasma morum]